jgi:adenylate cyclase
MNIEGATLKHSTVMSADVVGYTAMMAGNAGATLSGLVACFRRIEALVKQFGGRIVDAPGDNMMVEFPSEVGAVLCAIEVQRALEELRAKTTEKMHMRIGLHAGESIERYGKLYGHPVNVAARLQTAAEPDGVLLSEAVADRLPSTVQRGLHEVGARSYKNVPERVVTYRARP